MRIAIIPGEAEALLHPINFEESFGLSVAESMFCGTPVIAYRRGAMPELIKDGETGFLVGNAREAVKCINRVPEISRTSCRKWALKNFSQQAMVDRYLQVYERILQE